MPAVYESTIFGTLEGDKAVPGNGYVPPFSVERAEALGVTVDGDPVNPPDGPPVQAAAKAAWVDFAVSQGRDREEAEAMTKDELIEAFG